MSNGVVEVQMDSFQSTTYYTKPVVYRFAHLKIKTKPYLTKNELNNFTYRCIGNIQSLNNPILREYVNVILISLMSNSSMLIAFSL